MPRAFENCIKKGGRVKRISGPNKKFGLKAGEYINVCFLNDKMYRGEKHKKKKK